VRGIDSTDQVFIGARARVRIDSLNLCIPRNDQRGVKLARDRN